MTHRPGSNDAGSWLVSIRDGGHFRWGHREGDVVAEWVGILTVRIRDGGKVEYAAAQGADPELVDKVKHGGAAAFVRSLRGQPSLHGSAVARAGRAVVCLGESGSGKSTAASKLCTVYGCELLADDTVGLEFSKKRWWVLPTEASHWLASGGNGKKTPVAPRALGHQTALLFALVSLRFDAELRTPLVRRLRGADLYAGISPALLRFEQTESVFRHELDVLSSIADEACMYELVRRPSDSPDATADRLAKLMDEAP